MSAKATWQAWLEACAKCGGASNGMRAAGAQFYISAQPRVQANGAIVGRVYRFEPGHGLRDVGAFKIAPDGRVVQCPPELAAALPSSAPACENSASRSDDDAEPSQPQQDEPQDVSEPEADRDPAGA